MRVLGIETSCDETGVAVYDSEQGLLAHTLYSQVAVHAEYGGVVPELASRDHVRKLLPLIRQVLADAHCSSCDINGIAFTSGPGLIGALMVGASVGRSLAYAWQVPAVAVHHMEGHLLAPLLEEEGPSFRVPIIVTRDTTERPEAVEAGAVVLVGTNEEKLFEVAQKLLTNKEYYLSHTVDENPYGDGTASSQIIQILLDRFLAPT